jgi:phosphoglycerate kinase
MFFLKNQSFINEKVLIRLDLNVPLDDHLNVTDSTRIQACKETVDFVINNGGACVLMAHLGRPEGKQDVFSLSHILNDVSKCFGREVQFINDCIGDSVEQKVSQLKSGEILLLENLRFYKEETTGDEVFAKKLSALADSYINDAFGTCHREHASTYTIAQYFPKKKYAGKLLEKELNVIGKILDTGKAPILSILGGAKVSSKLKIINNLIDQVDQLIIAGGMAFTFIKAKGGEIGDSLFEPSLIDEANSILEKANKLRTQVHLPIDVLAGNEFNNSSEEKVFNTSSIQAGWMGMDISTKTIDAFETVIMSSNTIFWNGPMGVFEKEKFSTGTRRICEILKKAKEAGKYVIVGGGDSIAALKKFGNDNWVSYISTGGGAMLESLEGKQLPGVKALN